MKRLVTLAALATLLLAGAHDGSAAATSVKKLTIRQAVDVAVADSPDLAIAALSIPAAEARVSGAKRLVLPSLSTNATLQLWNGPIEFDLGMGNKLVARDQLTSNVSLTLAQPITGLFVVNRLVFIEKKGVEIARTQLQGAKLNVAAQTAVAYLRAMEANKSVEIAQKSVEQFDAQVERAKVLNKAGVLAPVDVMRLESGRSVAAQAVLGAQDAYAQAIDAMGLLIGLSTEVVVEPVDDLPEALPSPPWDEATAIELAWKQRPELHDADLKADQADGAVDIKRSEYFPNVNALAQYQHTEGAGEFSEPDGAFVGVTVEWKLWDWGKRGQDVLELRTRARQARMSAKRLRASVATDVRGKLRASHTAYNQLAVAESSLKTSEESYRIQTVRFQNGSSTTLDVLDAETEVARARINAANHRYDYAIALVQLAHAIGEPPLVGFQGVTPKAATGGESR